MRSYVFPGDIDPQLMKICSAPIPYMRTAEFSEIVKDTERVLLELVGCNDGRTIIYTGSGTGAMDAVVNNYVCTCKKAMVIDGGSFGHRWAELCKYYDCNYSVFEVPFAKDPDYDELERRIEVEKIDVLLCQHHETSSGELFDIGRISEICKRHNVSLVVDIISSFLAEPFNMDELGVDICITSTQKGLNILPGLSIIFMSKRILEHKFAHKGYYFDFEENLKNLTRGQTPFSPATTLFLQLHKRVLQLKNIGVCKNIEIIRQRSMWFREICNRYGWDMPAQSPSCAITSFVIHKNGEILVRTLIEENEIYIMPSGGHKNLFRVSHMGEQTYEDLVELGQLIHNIEQR